MANPLRMTQAEFDAHQQRVAAGARQPRIEAAPEILRPAAKMETTLAPVPTTDESGLNKLESAWLAILRARERVGELAAVETHGITLKLANDCRYTPDFIGLENGRLVCWETKGFFRDDAKVKIRVAARKFSWIRFVVVTKDKAGWHQEEVKP